MNNPFNINQWLIKQSPMSPPADDFVSIYEQLDKPKTVKKLFYTGSVAAAIAMLALTIVFFKPQRMSVDMPLNTTTLAQLKQQISRLEQLIQAGDASIVSHPGSTQLEQRVMLEKWLNHLNQRLTKTDNPHQQQSLLQAKLSVLQHLKPNPSIQLI